MGMRKDTAWALAAIGVVFLSLGIAAVHDLSKLIPKLIPADIPWNQSLAEEVVSEVSAGKLKPDPEGVVVLPSHDATASVTGCVYVNHPGRGLSLIVFPTVGGGPHAHFNAHGYLYCSRPLTRADTVGRDTFTGKESIKLHFDTYKHDAHHTYQHHAHRPAVPGSNQEDTGAVLDLMQKLSPHWYEIWDPVGS